MIEGPKQTREDAYADVTQCRTGCLVNASDEYVEALAALLAEWAGDIVEESNRRSARKLAQLQAAES